MCGCAAWGAGAGAGSAGGSGVGSSPRAAGAAKMASHRAAAPAKVRRFVIPDLRMVPSDSARTRPPTVSPVGCILTSRRPAVAGRPVNSGRKEVAPS
ncbi:MAG: hypothetical protein E6K72_12395 [Candidatus Eisenbacteria bacterium]|uniref:Uncharacterized protein n=1 Tax=Eiseniibacteriota bacterium TaxID=2212470 RepID=A0A538SD57_UNCEI|nr:MAG: hypothetical protein E6K72_12395 [Candidatus Eisenbacteria bacterium]